MRGQCVTLRFSCNIYFAGTSVVAEDRDKRDAYGGMLTEKHQESSTEQGRTNNCFSINMVKK